MAGDDSMLGSGIPRRDDLEEDPAVFNTVTVGDVCVPDSDAVAIKGAAQASARPMAAMQQQMNEWRSDGFVICGYQTRPEKNTKKTRHQSYFQARHFDRTKKVLFCISSP